MNTVENVNSDGNGTMHLIFLKRVLIQALNRSAYCVVQERNGNAECVKNRYDKCTMECIKNKKYIFEKLKLSDLNGTEHDVQRKYFGKNIWLLLDE